MKWWELDSLDIWLAIFIIFMGAMGAGSAAQFGPQMGKALKSAFRIFSIIDEKSEIDASQQHGKRLIDLSNFQGLIEFKNVWF